MELMTERGFESITVQDVLDRAGVGRSTFYVHYEGKNDLFTSDVDRFWSRIAESIPGASSDRVLPVREVLDHVSDTRDFQNALRASGKYSEVFDSGRLHIAAAIEQRLARSPRARNVARAHLRAISRMQAAAFISLIEWWMGREQPITAAEADDLFHRMFWASVER